MQGNGRASWPRGLILAPTRELVQQIFDEVWLSFFFLWSAITGVHAYCMYVYIRMHVSYIHRHTHVHVDTDHCTAGTAMYTMYDACT